MVSLRGLFIAEWSRGILQNARIMVALLILPFDAQAGVLKTAQLFTHREQIFPLSWKEKLSA